MIVLPYPPQTCTIFCDETAHGGPNWLDKQPFYVTAAWIVREEHLHTFHKQLDTLREEIHLRDAGAEVKGRHFRNNPRRQSLALSWFRAVRNDDIPLAFPAYYILERRFGACGKIVDLLLDPGHNEAAEWLPTGDLQQREDVTEMLYSECPGEALTAFCEALKRPSLPLWNETLGMLAGFEWSDPRLRTSLLAAHRLASDLFDVEFGHYLSENKNPALPHSPNYFSFRHLLQSCDIAVRRMWPNCRASLVHDEQKQYSEYFTDIVHFTTGIGRSERDTGVRLPELIGGLHAVTEFRMGNSREEPGIQA